MLISGDFQKQYLNKYLRWPKNKIQSVESFRYIKKNLDKMEGYIYLPYAISNFQIIIKEFKNFLSISKKKSLHNYKIKNHPLSLNSKKHLKLIKAITRLMIDNKDKFGKNISHKTSIFIGSTTSIILALEQKIEIIHICEDPIFDSFNEKIWNMLSVIRISEFTFKYNIKNKKKILKISENNNNKIKEYLK